jgi:hypothetical protein
VFRGGVDPLQLYISIAALGYFYLSNNATLAPFGAMRLRPKMVAHWSCAPAPRRRASGNG